MDGKLTNKLLTVQQAAEFLNVKPDSVRYLRRTRQLGSLKVAGKVRFKPEHIEEYLDRHETPASSFAGSESP